MGSIILSTKINAPRERCFDFFYFNRFAYILASKSKEQVISGITEGLIKLNETEIRKAKHYWM